MDEEGASELVAVQNMQPRAMADAPDLAQSVPASMARMRSLVAATVAALKQLPGFAHQVASSELATVVGELDELAAFGTAGVGSTAGQQISTTPHCCAGATIQSCTAINSPAPSSTGTCCGTEDPAPTSDREHAWPERRELVVTTQHPSIATPGLPLSRPNRYRLVIDRRYPTDRGSVSRCSGGSEHSVVTGRSE
ncbi:MAG: hypothetical protein M3Y77_10285 [Actinomycetota bacterium]|nr:hypothetical protein [Actinomycetota bacterium]